MGQVGTEEAPSSFWIHGPEVVFDKIGLKSGDAFLYLGCGVGDYAIYAAGGRRYASPRQPSFSTCTTTKAVRKSNKRRV